MDSHYSGLAIGSGWLDSDELEGCIFRDDHNFSRWPNVTKRLTPFTNLPFVVRCEIRWSTGKSGSWRPFVADKPVGLAVEK
jgi:hypothetical protein